MPAAWSKKDERQYRAIKKSCLARDARRTRACPRIAAATVNKQRRKEGRTLSGLGQPPDVIPALPAWAEALIGLGLLGLIIAAVRGAKADE
jgi:hypothetical protein